MRPNMVK